MKWQLKENGNKGKFMRLFYVILEIQNWKMSRLDLGDCMLCMNWKMHLLCLNHLIKRRELKNMYVEQMFDLALVLNQEK